MTRLLQPGTFLRSKPLLDGTYFEKADLVITEYNNNGAVGFILNRPFERFLNELEEFKHLPAIPLYEGGPVDQEHLFFIHQRPDAINGGYAIGTIYCGGNFTDVVNGISNETIKNSDIKIFIGYCGWNFGELEAEIGEGSWEVVTGIDAFNG